MNTNEQISLIRRMLDILFKIAGLQTQLEKIQVEEMVRKIAANYAVDVETLVAVIKCESGMNPKAVNRNTNGTTDYGLCQFNDYWYRDKISPQTALNHPEIAVNVMCQAWVNGRAKDWICYRNGGYIKHLPVKI